MPDFRYAQMCPLARACEVLADRWTLLIVRELLLGARRFTDLRAQLPGVSTSVLSERLAHLETFGVVEKRSLPAPAPAVVYALTADGEALREPLLSLSRWGARFLARSQPGDHFSPGWARLAFEMAARAEATPGRVYTVTVRDAEPAITLRVQGGPGGTSVTPSVAPSVTASMTAVDASSAPGAESAAAATATLRADGLVFAAVLSGQLPLDAAIAGGAIEASGEVAGFRELFAPLDREAVPAEAGFVSAEGFAEAVAELPEAAAVASSNTQVPDNPTPE